VEIDAGLGYEPLPPCKIVNWSSMRDERAAPSLLITGASGPTLALSLAELTASSARRKADGRQTGVCARPNCILIGINVRLVTKRPVKPAAGAEENSPADSSLGNRSKLAQLTPIHN